VVGNMKPSKFRGVLSEGMLLAASKENIVELLEPAAGSIVGERVQIDTMHELGQPDAVLKPKQRVMELVAADLCTDTSCIATWKNMALKTSAGFVRCKSIENGIIS
jgi:tRNA-binding EMAP/Myf-like protein